MRSTSSGGGRLVAPNLEISPMTALKGRRPLPAMSTQPGQPQASTSGDLLRGARFAPTAGTSSEFAAPTASQLLQDASALHPLAGLNKGELDYLLLDDAKLSEVAGGQTVLPARSWGDELCYGTGTTYLAGESQHSARGRPRTRS